MEGPETERDEISGRMRWSGQEEEIPAELMGFSSPDDIDITHIKKEPEIEIIHYLPASHCVDFDEDMSSRQSHEDQEQPQENPEIEAATETLTEAECESRSTDGRELWMEKVRPGFTEVYPELDFARASERLCEMWRFVPPWDKLIWQQAATQMHAKVEKVQEEFDLVCQEQERCDGYQSKEDEDVQVSEAETATESDFDADSENDSDSDSSLIDGKMLWNEETRRRLLRCYPKLDATSASKRLREAWRYEPPSQRMKWQQQAMQMKYNSRTSIQASIKKEPQLKYANRCMNIDATKNWIKKRKMENSSLVENEQQTKFEMIPIPGRPNSFKLIPIKPKLPQVLPSSAISSRKLSPVHKVDQTGASRKPNPELKSENSRARAACPRRKFSRTRARGPASSPVLVKSWLAAPESEPRAETKNSRARAASPTLPIQLPSCSKLNSFKLPIKTELPQVSPSNAIISQKLSPEQLPNCTESTSNTNSSSPSPHLSFETHRPHPQKESFQGEFSTFISTMESD